jgi:alpha-tubulin suppressor-like RCC1 family protein
MAVTGSITTRFIDEKGVDLGKTLIEKDYLISVYPNIMNQFNTPMLMTWGYNGYGELGNNTIIDTSNPVQTIANGANWKSFACGNLHTAAIKTDGTLWMFGYNVAGALGDNTVTNKSSPVQTVTFATNWKQVSTGYHTAAIKTDGTLWLWGANGNTGQLGDNTVVRKSSPVQTVAFGTNWKQVSCSSYYTAAIKTDGTLWIWGRNNLGQLGDNTIINKSSPIQTITFGTNWKNVSAGGRATAAIKNDGTLWIWGEGDKGELGDNLSGINKKSSPIQTVAFGTNWKSVSAGYYHTTAIKTDGTLWCWGANSSGQLGDNTVIPKSSPVQTVAFGTNWKQVSAGFQFTAAIKTDGTFWNWGINTPYGQLGDNTIINRSSPVQTTAYGTNWKQVACGGYHAVVIKDGDF